MSFAQPGDTNGKRTIYDRIWAAIAERKLAPGTRLKEEHLAEIFGTSRARVRQALQALNIEGLVTIQPNRGATVAEPTVEEAQDIFFARRAVETSLVERLCAIRTPAILARLRAHVAEERATRLAGDTEAVVRLSGGFHMLLGESAGSPYLSEVLRDLVSRTSLIITMYQARYHHDCGPDEHDQVVIHIEAGNTAAAVACMEHHLDHIESQLDLSRKPGRDIDLKEIFS